MYTCPACESSNTHFFGYDEDYDDDPPYYRALYVCDNCSEMWSEIVSLDDEQVLVFPRK